MERANLHFTKFKCKNLATIGDEFITVELDRNPTTVVYGANGSSKSSLFVDGIMYCLYGKPFKKIKISDLVNNRNQRGLLTEIEFYKGKDHYKIVRGYKPQVFEIYMNGEKLPEKTSQQELLDKEIIGVPYPTFRQIVVMGKANYQSFMDLAKDKRREFVETILDISVFREMLNQHKENYKSLTKSLDFKKKDLEHKGNTLDNYKRVILDLKSQQKQDKEKDIALLEDEVKALEEELSGISYDENALNDALKIIKEDVAMMQQIEKKKAMFQSKKASYDELLEFLENNEVCPTCKQEIHSSHKDTIREDITTNLNENNDIVKKLDRKKEKLHQRIEKNEEIRNNLTAVKFNIERLTNEINMLKNRIHVLVSKPDTTDNDAIKKTKQKAKDELVAYKALEQEIEDLKIKLSVYDDATNLLSDTGIKAIVINNYISIINSLINKNLSELGLFATLTFDEEFKDTIKKRGFEDFSYNQLSEGEKLRVDLSIMMAWRDVASMKSGLSCNLLIMDEIFNTSLDYQGCKAFIDILNCNPTQNSFIISPNADDIIDMCRSSIELKKVDGFTVIA